MSVPSSTGLARRARRGIPCSSVWMGTRLSRPGRLWAMAQFSRFVKLGAVRIEASSRSEVLHMSAFQNPDGTVAIQAINNARVDTQVSVSIGGCGTSAPSVQPYLTNSDHDLTSLKEIAIKDDTFVGHVPARAMASWVIRK